MANSWILDLVGTLDSPKSKEQINRDIEVIKSSLNKLELVATLAPNQVENIKQKLDSLQVELNNINASPQALDNLVQQINTALQSIQVSNINVNLGAQAQQTGQQIGQQISQGVSVGLNNNDTILKSFRDSLKDMQMGSAEIDSVSERVKNLGIQITSLNQAKSTLANSKGNKEVLTVEISGIDKFGQAIKLTEQYDLATGNLIKSLDAVATAHQKTGTNIDAFTKQQKTAVANLSNQIKQLKASAIDPNAKNTISEQAHLDSLAKKYLEIENAIKTLGTASKEQFVDEQNKVKSLIAEYKILVSEYRNAENVKTNTKSFSLTTEKSVAKQNLAAFKANAQNYKELENTISKLEASLSNINDAATLKEFNNQLKIARAELAKVKAEAEALNAKNKVALDVSGLTNKISDLKNTIPEIETFKASINNSEVSLQSLLDKLSNVKTHSDFTVVNAEFNKFIESAKAAGIITSDVENEIKKVAEQIQKIKELATGGVKNDYSTQIAKLEGNFKSLGAVSDETKRKISNVTNTLTKLQQELAKPQNEQSQRSIIELYNLIEQELIELSNEYTKAQASAKGFVSEQQRLTLANTIEAWNQKNSAATKEVIAQNEKYIAELRELDKQIDQTRFDKIKNGFKQAENSMRGLGKLGASVRDQFKRAYSSFTMWLSASTLVMKVISETREAVTELKEIDTVLTEISKANYTLSDKTLAAIGNSSFETASKYGKKATDYLTGVQEMARAGYDNIEAMGELSVKAQGAGAMTSDVANSFIVATDKAYKLNGSIKELTETLDGINYITNHNAVNMTELSEGFSVVASTASSFGVDANELTAALGTMAATTQQSGSEVARAFRAILLNIRQVSDEEEGIDAEGLTKYEKACNALGVSLKETRNGVIQTKDAMAVLEELSEAYSKLGEDDLRRTDLLNSIGGKLRATQLDALLRNWDTYENMLQQYSDGTGSMDREAAKTAASLEGALNRLSNTWADTVENIVSSDFLTQTVDVLNGILNLLNKLTDALGAIGSIAATAGIVAFFKNLG